MTDKTHLLEAERVAKEFRLGGLRGAKRVVHAVSDVSLTIDEGVTLAMVGESGCGKSTFGRLILRLIEPTGGVVLFQGRALKEMNGAEMRAVRRQIQIIFQDPYASLDPRMTVFQTIAEPLVTHKIYRTKLETEMRV